MEKQNHLGKEKSPYLLQHKDNPVYWYPWGEQALEAARRESKPIFLSIGYSTCYWCHVMEKDSFEQREVADVLNKYFISIKVDREERPDVDAIYMEAVLKMTGHGGWPMSVFLTPQGKPFFGGTYFPRARFLALLEKIRQAWETNNAQILQASESLFLDLQEQKLPSSIALTEETLKRAFYQWKERFDPVYGGFGSAPKFPPSMALSLLLRIYRRTNNREALKLATLTLDRMACGGIYDQLGGGFHRYSTDKQWLAPHFEKMLYDNALLSFTYLEAWQVTKKEMYKEVARRTLDYVADEMTHGDGGFYSAQDAGDVGKEGEFYVWEAKEVEEVLGKESSFTGLYDVSPSGNFEGHNILNIRDCSRWQESLQASNRALRAKLLERRKMRPPPHKDDKVLTAWNGLMIAAFARGFQVMGEERYLGLAQRSAQFLREKLWKNGKLLRRYRKGDSRFAGTLNDYAFLVYGLLHLYESDFDKKWLDWALSVQEAQNDLLWDKKDSGYFTSEASDTTLIYRKKDTDDGALPSGNSMSALNLLRLHSFTLNGDYKKQAEELLVFLSKFYGRFPSGYGQALMALDYYLSSQEIAVIDDGKRANSKEMRRFVYDSFLPNKVFAVGRSTDFGNKKSLPLFWGKQTEPGKATAYVCENHTCKLPTTKLSELKKLLDGFKSYSF